MEKGAGHRNRFRIPKRSLEGKKGTFYFFATQNAFFAYCDEKSRMSPFCPFPLFAL